jgi:myosin heavy subunit
MASLEERVDSLEDVLREFVTNVGVEFNKLYNAQTRTELELQAFKDEMKEFKDEMKEFKDEMKAYKEEGRRQNREMNRRWGELANKMGTLVEDLVAPSVPRIVREVLNQDVLDIAVRRQRKLADGRVREFDALAFTADTVCLNSTKSTLRSSDVEGFSEEVDAFRTFFPEQAAMPIVGMLASLAIEPSVLTYAERQGLVVLGVGDQLMEVKNSVEFTPKRW